MEHTCGHLHSPALQEPSEQNQEVRALKSPYF